MNEFMSKNFNLIFSLSLAWVAFVIVASIIYKIKKGKVFPDINESEVLYKENGASGASHKNFITRLGGARNCLVVTATKNEIDINLMFPFNLMFMPEIYDLRQRIPVKQIKNIERAHHTFGKPSIKITFSENSGNQKIVELYLGNTEKFLDSIDWRAV